MSTIFNDTFTVSVDTALTSHTPDTGTSWTEYYRDTATSIAEVYAATDTVSVTVSEVNLGVWYQPSPVPTTAEYDIQVTLTAVFTGSGTRTVHLVGRMLDANNGYTVSIINASLSPDVRLYKAVAGVKTELANANTDWVAGDVVKFSIRDASKTVYKNGVSVVSSADNSLTAAGSVLLGWGSMGGAAISGVGGHAHPTWQLDNFSLATTGSTYSMTVSRTSTSTTPDVAGLRVSRAQTKTLTSAATTPDTITLRGVPTALLVNRASASTTPDTAGLPVSRRLTKPLPSAATAPDTVTLARAFNLSGVSRASASTTPDTSLLRNIVPGAVNLTSGVTTPDTAGLPVSRRLSVTLASKSLTPDLPVVLRGHTDTVALDSRTFVVPARVKTFAVAADNRTFGAS